MGFFKTKEEKEAERKKALEIKRKEEIFRNILNNIDEKTIEMRKIDGKQVRTLNLTEEEQVVYDELINSMDWEETGRKKKFRSLEEILKKRE